MKIDFDVFFLEQILVHGVIIYLNLLSMLTYANTYQAICFNDL